MSTMLWPSFFTMIRHKSHDLTVMWVATSVEKTPYYDILYCNDNSIHFEMLLNFNFSGSVSFKHNLQLAWQSHGFVKSLICMVPFVMCIGEDPEDLLQPQVLFLWLWFWKGLQRRHGSPLHNVHVIQWLAVQVYNALWKPLSGKCTSPDYCTQ